MYLFMKHSSDHFTVICHDPLSYFGIDALSCMKLQMNHYVKDVTIN